jgi:hypothetical protein
MKRNHLRFGKLSLVIASLLGGGVVTGARANIENRTDISGTWGGQMFDDIGDKLNNKLQPGSLK